MPTPRENPRPDRALTAALLTLVPLFGVGLLVVGLYGAGPVYGQFVPPSAGETFFEGFEEGNSLPDRWIGDRARFAVTLRNGSRWLGPRIDSERTGSTARPDTVALARASRADPGHWEVRVAHEENLTSDRALRWYLTATRPSLRGELRGYYLQLGGNNLDRIALYRQDGPRARRALVGASETGRTAGDSGTYVLRAEREAEGRWAIYRNGTLELTAVDSTYRGSRYTGFWIGHRRGGAPALFLDDLRVAGPIDETAPRVRAARYDTTSGSLQVTFNEPIDPDRTDPSAFQIEPLVGPPAAVEANSPPTRRVRLTFEPPLRPGRYALTVPGVADLSGNPAPRTHRRAFEVAGDTTAPRVVLLEGLRGPSLLAHLSEPIDPASLPLLTLRCRPHATPTGPAHLVGRDAVAVSLNGETLPRACRLEGLRDRIGLSVRPEMTPLTRRPALGELLVTEIMYRPGPASGARSPTATSTPEYVELWNRSAEPRSLYGVTLLLDDRELVPARPPAALPGHTYWVLFADPDTGPDPAVQSRLARAFPDRTFPRERVRLTPIRRQRLGLLDEGGRLTLRGADGEGLEEIPYEPAWHHPALADPAGVALERRSAEKPSDAPGNWSSSPARGTPGGPNAVGGRPPSGEPPSTAASLELAPNPFSPDGDGWEDALAVRGRFASETPSVRIRIFDARGRMVRELEPGRITGAEHVWHWDGRSDEGTLLPTGIYVIALEELEAGGGTARMHREAAVLARPR